MPKHKPPPSDDNPSSAKLRKSCSPANQSSSLTVHFDWTDWLTYLEDTDGTEDQMREYIETVWTIVMVFFDLEMDVRSDPEPCGQNLDLAAALKAAVLELEDTQQLEEV